MSRGSSVTKCKLSVTTIQLIAFPGNPVALCHLIGVGYEAAQGYRVTWESHELNRCH